MKTNEPMKNKTRDEDDANQSLFSAAGVRPNHPFSKTTHFADISSRVYENIVSADFLFVPHVVLHPQFGTCVVRVAYRNAPARNSPPEMTLIILPWKKISRCIHHSVHSAARVYHIPH
jgi:hypothetical protein